MTKSYVVSGPCGAFSPVCLSEITSQGTYTNTGHLRIVYMLVQHGADPTATCELRGVIQPVLGLVKNETGDWPGYKRD